MDEPHIGDFARPLVKRPEPAQSQQPQSSASAPQQDKLAAAEARLAAEANKVEESLKPLATYEEQLKAVGVTKEKAAEIVDAVLMQGFYSEPFSLTSRIKGRLRSREYRDTLRTQRQLEIEVPKHQTTYNEINYRYQLAASLEQYASTSFKFPDRNTSTEEAEKMFETRLRFIEGLPEATTQLLFSKLEKFNRKVFIVCQEGAIENF